jgi:hypothetical protein
VVLHDLRDPALDRTLPQVGRLIVGSRKREDAMRAELIQLAVNHDRRLTELRVGGRPDAKHGKLQMRQLILGMG